MKNLTSRLNEFLAGLYRRFAAPALICLFLAVNVVWQECLHYIAPDTSGDTLDLLDRLFTIGWSSLCWATAGCCLRERYGWHGCIGWIAAVLGVGIALLFPVSDSMVTVSLMLAMLCLCLYGVSGREQRAEHLAQVCGRFCLCLGISVVLFIALEVIATAVPALFMPDVPGRVTSIISYCVISLCFLIIAPWFFLGSLPRADEPAEPRAAFRKFSANLLLPLYLILLAVLLAYVLKIIVTRTMPVGVMNGYALGALTLFAFFHLILTGEENRLSRLFTRWGGWLLLPILIVQQVGVWMRYDAYGFTPSRIYGIAVTLLCAAIVVSAILRRRANWFFIAAAVVSFVVVGSPLNAETLSRWNQESRLRAALERNAMLTASGEITANPQASAADRAIIYSALDYLDTISAPEDSLTAALQAQMSELAPQLSENLWYASDTCKHALLGFPRSEEWTTRRITCKSSVTSSEVDVQGYVHARWVTGKSAESISPYENHALTAEFDIHSVTDGLDSFFTADAAPAFPDAPITFSMDGETFDLSPLLASAVDTTEDATSRTRTYTLPEYEVTLPSGKVFRLAQLTISDLNEVADIPSYYSTDSLTVTGWLLTPEAE